MFSTLGVILTVVGALQCLLGTLLLSKWWRARPVRRASPQDSASTPEEKAPPRWESRLLEVETELASLCSNFEKVNRQLMRLNSRAGMRELRARSSASEAPPVGAPKAELRRYYGVNGLSGPDQAAKQLDIEGDRS